MKRHLSFLSIATLGFVVAFAGIVAANGEEFFAPAKNGKVDLVYFGRIKDSRTGRSVADSAYFVLTDKATGLSFPFTNDRPGHYRSPDIGAGIKDIGEKVDVKGFEIDVNVAGYKKVTITKVPRTTQGTVEVDLSLDPIVSGTVTAAGLGSADRPPYTRTWLILVASVVVFFIVRGARTAGRPQTTKR